MLVAAVIALAVIAAILALLAWNARTGRIERAFLYFPVRTLVATPADAGLVYEDVFFEAENGPTLHGWFIPGSQPVTVLWFHGNAGNIGSRVPWIRELHAATGYSIFVFDYRGYGRSEGQPSEHGLYRDAAAALAHVRADARVERDRIVYFGRSLGSAVAVELATRHPPLALVLETPFPSLRWLAHEVYPWLPVARWLHERYGTEQRARQIDVPSLVIHGERDEIMSVEGSRRVAGALAGAVELYIVPGAHHNDIPTVAGAGYYRRLIAFVDRALAGQRS